MRFFQVIPATFSAFLLFGTSAFAADKVECNTTSVSNILGEANNYLMNFQVFQYNRQQVLLNNYTLTNSLKDQISLTAMLAKLHAESYQAEKDFLKKKNDVVWSVTKGLKCPNANELLKVISDNWGPLTPAQDAVITHPTVQLNKLLDSLQAEISKLPEIPPAR